MTKAEDRMDEMVRKGFVPNLFSGVDKRFRKKEKPCPEEAEWDNDGI